MQNLHLLEHLAEAFWCHMHHYQCLTAPVQLYCTDGVVISANALRPFQDLMCSSVQLDAMEFVLQFTVVGIAEKLVWLV